MSRILLKIIKIYGFNAFELNSVSLYCLIFTLKIQTMIKLFSILALLVVTNNEAAAQYYYKDILSVKQTRADQRTYKAKQIRTIDVHSFEFDDQPSKGFFCEKQLSKDYKKMDTYTRTSGSSKSLLTSYFDDLGFLIRSEDSSEINVSYAIYKYDKDSNLVSISTQSKSHDDDFITALNEIHQYNYDARGILQNMFLIKNGKDTTEIDFTVDDKGNITDESEVSESGIHYFYYYDSQNRLTDIAHYNVVKKQTLPDFIFQYDDAGELVQMIVTMQGATSNYNIWSYLYDDGLRIKEKCYSKDKELLGYFEYEYLNK